jgi:hypothetical protein
VDRTVALQEGRRVGSGEFAVGVLERLGREVRVQAGEGLANASVQDDVTVVGVRALGRGFAGGDVGAVEGLVAQGFEPGQGGIFD